MSDERTPRFDPRFSPAFQRGFDPADAVEEQAAVVERPRVTVPATAGPAAASRRYVAPPIPDVVRSPVVAPVEPAGGVVVAPLPDPLHDPLSGPDETRTATNDRTGRNPFVVALAIVAVVLIIAGIGLFSWAGTAFNSTRVGSQGAYMSLDALLHAAPFVALLGLATAIAVLFVFAARWRR